MKGQPDDGNLNPNPQSKLPFDSSRVESYGQSQGLGGGGGGGGGSAGGGDGTVSTQRLSTHNAFSYLKEVRDTYQDQRHKYDMFLHIMKEFKAQRIDTKGVIVRVEDLFKGHPELLVGFNTFLPKGCEIKLTDEDEATPKQIIEYEKSISLVNKIKKRFQDDVHVYKSFLNILHMYQQKAKGIADVYSEVAILFENHSDLLDEFASLLPASWLKMHEEKKCVDPPLIG